jgi:hypothetical protein
MEADGAIWNLLHNKDMSLLYSFSSNKTGNNLLSLTVD